MLDELLAPLVADLKKALRAKLVALYLTGSAAAGDFDLRLSDIDLVAVIDGAVEDLDMAALDAVHRRFVCRNLSWNDRLEIVYVAASTLATGGRANQRVAVISPGEAFHLTGPASDWLQNWFLLRAQGVALVGPPPSSVVGDLSTDEFIKAARRYLDYIAGEPLEEHSAGGLAYAVLSVCRALYTIETGAQVSKRQAAEWLGRTLPDWRDVADGAVAVRGGSTKPSPDWRRRAIDFVHRSATSCAQQKRDTRSDQRVGAQRDG